MTLSTAESELIASIECAVALNGHGSWRTRHLRARAEFLREQTQSGELRLVFCPGVEQLAAKALPSARIEELVQLWGMQTFTVGETTHADQEVRPSTSVAVDNPAFRECPR